MKRFKSLSVVLASALLVSSIPMTAFGVTTGGDISGGGTIIDGYILDVDVPTSVPFTVNPQEFGVTVGADTLTGQIISPGYSFRNRSSMPIQLDVIPTFTSADGITVVTSADEILNTNNEGHKIYLEVQPATVKADVKSAANQGVSAPAITLSTNYTTGPAITKEATAKLSFKLNSAVYKPNSAGTAYEYDNTAFASDDAVAFKFGGKVSKYAKWDGKIININVKYDFGTISDGDYVDPTNEAAAGYNVLKKDLLKNGPSLTGTSAGVISIQDGNDIMVVKDGTTIFQATELMCIISDDPINTSLIVPEDVVRGEEYAPLGKRISQIAPTHHVWDRETGVASLNAAGKTAVSGKYCVFFIRGNKVLDDTSDQYTLMTECILMD